MGCMTRFRVLGPEPMKSSEGYSDDMFACIVVEVCFIIRGLDGMLRGEDIFGGVAFNDNDINMRKG